MKVCCEACGCEAELEIKGLTDLNDALPHRWRRRIIDDQAYILCDICGHAKQILGGASAYLQDALDLSPNAVCIVPESDDFEAPRANRTS